MVALPKFLTKFQTNLKIIQMKTLQKIRYKDKAAYEKEGFEEAAKKAFPEYKDKDWDDFY
jgi:hypothetical protein